MAMLYFAMCRVCTQVSKTGPASLRQLARQPSIAIRSSYKLSNYTRTNLLANHESTFRCNIIHCKKFTASSTCLNTKHTECSHKCWKCERPLDSRTELFFCECGVVMKPCHDVTYFSLLGVEQSYDVDVKELFKMYTTLQSLLHPDKFSQKSETEKQYSEDQSQLLNEAYHTLAKPLSRGLYLLHLHNQPITEEDSSGLGGVFLEEILRTNEELLEISDIESFTKFQSANNATMDTLYGRLSAAFEEEDIQTARTLLTQLKYYSNIADKLKDLYLKLLT